MIPAAVAAVLLALLGAIGLFALIELRSHGRALRALLARPAPPPPFVRPAPKGGPPGFVLRRGPAPVEALPEELPDEQGPPPGVSTVHYPRRTDADTPRA